MVSVLAKPPKVVVPWPPTTGGLEPCKVLPGEDFGAFCKRNSIAFKDLMLKNFQIDITADKDWELVCNWYLWNKVGCRSLTPKGNCKFSGGETLYVPRAGKPKPPTPPRDRADIVQWFIQDILPARTIGPGNITNGNFMLKRGGKVLDRLRGGGPDPNGICGAAADYVMEQYQNFGNTGTTLGYILWQQAMFFTHVANVIMPVPKVLVYEGSDFRSIAIPEEPSTLPFSRVSHWTVLDLYFMKTATVENWWREVSYLGWGRLVLDPDGVYINS